MVQISTDDIRHLATLSALALTDEEVNSMQSDIANILEYIEQLSELDTSSVKPSYQVTGLSNVFRDDVVADEDISGRNLVENLAPSYEDGQYKVPKVL